MLMQHIGFRVRGFYKIASLSNKQEAMMSTNAQQMPHLSHIVVAQYIGLTVSAQSCNVPIFELSC